MNYADFLQQWNPLSYKKYLFKEIQENERNGDIEKIEKSIE